jgi:dTDP-4-amino-4,6-dideoxygalactose transaminase
MEEAFKGSFTQQEPIPEDAIQAAVEVMRSGRLHRYNVLEDEMDQTASLEVEFSKLVGSKYALAVASGGYALGCALRAVGVRAGDLVLSNGFTLAPVPGAIAGVGARPVFVETMENLTIDFNDLELKINKTGANILLLSHMRGHVCDMDSLMEICNRNNVVVVEDCAHTMGASWRDVVSGRHGIVGCYSCQTYKHINSGEGGFLVSDDQKVMAKAVILSGSYMLYGRHKAAPPEAAYDQIKLNTPNISGRMDNLRAAILRPQLRNLSDRVSDWNERYSIVENSIRNTTNIKIIERDIDEHYVGSSFQFIMPNLDGKKIKKFVHACGKRGVELKWFGAPEPKAFTSRYDSWAYAAPERLVRTDKVLAGLIDMRLPLTFSLKDCQLIGRIICNEAIKIKSEN